VPEVSSLMKCSKVLRVGHPLLRTGKRLESLSEFYDAATEIAERWKPENALIVSGDTVLNERASRLKIAGMEISLSRIQALMFRALLQNANSIVSSSELMNLSKTPREYFVRQHISMLRRKLGRRFRQRLVTVKNEGVMYRSTKLIPRHRLRAAR